MESERNRGRYMRPLCMSYFIWDPVVHHRSLANRSSRKARSSACRRGSPLSAARQEHQELLAEFESLLRGVETALEAAELGARRLTDEELFLETKRALNPLSPDRRPYRRGEEQLDIQSAREQIADVSIVDETDSYLNLGGILYSFVSLKDLPGRDLPRNPARAGRS